MSFTPTANSDLVLQTEVSDYMMATLPDVLAYVASGAASLDYRELASMGGNSVTLRRFQEDTTAATPDDATEDSGVAMTSYSESVILARRRRTRYVPRALRAALGSAAPDAVLREIGRQGAYYWAKTLETSLTKTITGVMTTALSSSNVLAKAQTSGTPVTFSRAHFIDAQVLLGDNMDRLAIAIFPSAIWGDAKKDNAQSIAYLPITNSAGVPLVDEAGKPVMATYFDGKRVILSDQMPVTAGSATKYDTYRVLLVGVGALGLVMQSDVETNIGWIPERNSDALVQAAAYGAHVYGVGWTGTPADPNVGPTDTELATGSNWTKKATTKEIKIVQYTVNRVV